MVSPSKRYLSHLMGRVFAALHWEGIRAPAFVTSKTESHFLLMRTVLCAGEGCVQDPTLPL